MTRFSKMELRNGHVIETSFREIKQSDLQKCPHCIFNADHYRDDGSCKCDDPDAKEMKTWGYTWRDGQWRS